jgi:hypothetical protein
MKRLNAVIGWPKRRVEYTSDRSGSMIAHSINCLTAAGRSRLDGASSALSTGAAAAARRAASSASRGSLTELPRLVCP